MSESKDTTEVNQEVNEKASSQSTKKQINFKRSHFIIILIVTILVTAVIAVFATIGISHWTSGLNSNQRAEMKKVEQVYQTLDDEYYKDTSSEELGTAAIDSMVKKLDDPYSDYMTKKETKSFNEDVSGDFVGIGAEMQKKGNQIQITSPMKQSPAEKAGIQPKDVVTKVNGKSIKGQPLEAIVKKVRGKQGTKVTLTIERGGQAHDITIKRDKIHVKSVEYQKHGDVGVFTINKFQNSTSGELKSAIIKAHKDGIRKIVLDLRNNPGGLLDEAVKMANIFIDKNETVVQLEKGKHKEAIKASNDASKEAKDMDVSILVNKGSASASEVFTGAMKDYNKAKVYGSKTFGKGIVQTTREFEDGSLLKFTNMKWLTPKSHYIHGKGITPDKKIEEPAYQSLNVIPSNKTYQLGDDDKNVKTMKVGLNALGYHINNQSTEFDSELEDALKSFQKKNNLDVNGTFNKSTNEKFTQQLVEKANKEDTVLNELLKKLN
ncbi:PDZ domain-containing protein [Staphylococcus saprophyticus]|uniref:S41 family peptidase n=1 Tax=Staphylococcus saprophyticus TaxID=29385 RepID=UPI00094BA8F1|nr:S41 family peptidase [Staphylococcus saprophyticus]MDW4274261.1 S41 family peptidase [Staphylococcus saprophyticus]MDW4382895.1 S41 family peptidase [Staphylococcus saprophyticus]MEB5646377.1 S41 family peptidase [Staphylococcus saprophyticus]OLN94890.1 serine protease [Staphylococcus saprophyticus]RXS03696.1 PDZ domain-containing protein [Staphylococcus saprophyticus]